MGTGTTINIKKGLDIPLAGAPQAEIVDLRPSGLVTIYPSDFKGIKPRLLVSEGDVVKRGTALFFNKKSDSLRCTSPAGGRVQSIVIGQRRMIERIVIETAGREEIEEFRKHEPESILRLMRDEILAKLLTTGLIIYIRQRPFSRMADPLAQPKSIFVNGMATAPFQADPHVCVRGYEAAFQAGLNALTRLTNGKVYLCIDQNAHNPSPALNEAKHVEIVRFSGPHPAGNTSVHIHHVDPIKPHDIVWTVQAADLVLIGRLLVEGKVPESRVIALGGPGVREQARSHYRVRIGESLGHILNDRLEEGEQRLVRGDVLSGQKASRADSLHLLDRVLNVLPEGRERNLLGWIMPGLDQHSQSRTFASRWLRPNATWPLNTNMHGSKRAMVLTGLYDRYLPMMILPDFLIRAILAHDVEEAIKLGILEVDPEDFALPAFACPSKMDLVGIIRQGLAQIEREGV